MGGTLLDARGNEVFATRVHSLPLPPPLPGRFVPEFNGNNQYRLPDPATGEIRSYSRATSLSKVLDDPYLLLLWEKRNVIIGMQRAMYLQSELDQVVDQYLATGGQRDHQLTRDLREPLNRIVSDAERHAGADWFSEFGTAVHDWAAMVDMGLCTLWDVPEMFRLHVRRYLEVTAARGVVMVPQYVERIVFNSTLKMAGTIDRLIDVSMLPGSFYPLALGDLKTSRTLAYSWLGFGVQLGFYSSCDLMLAEDGSHWEPMPDMDDTTATLINVPSDDPDSSRLVPVDIELGRDLMHAAIHIRDVRKSAAENVPAPEQGYPVHETIARRLQLRVDIMLAREETQLARLWQGNQDIWTDDLTSLGRKTIHAYAHAQRTWTP